MNDILASLARPETWGALLTLSAMEVVLGIDNVIFISIIAARVPIEERDRLRRLGLVGALFMRLGLLFALAWIMGLTKPLLTVAGFDVSGRSLILLGGGLFLIAKSVHEIHATPWPSRWWWSSSISACAPRSPRPTCPTARRSDDDDDRYNVGDDGGWPASLSRAVRTQAPSGLPRSFSPIFQAT